MKLRHVFTWLLGGLAAALSAQTASLTANTTTYSPSGGQVVLTASIRYPATSGIVGSITVTNAGSGYTSAPTVVLTGGGGSGASAVLNGLTDGGGIQIVSVANAGSGYTAAPAVTFSGGGGTGAAAVAALAPVAGLGFTINLPPAWSVVSVASQTPSAVGPSPGDSGPLEFAFVSFPPGETSFTVTASYPANLAGLQTISSSAIFRPPQTIVSIPDVVLSAPGSAPSVPPQITTQPVSQSINPGATLTLNVAATGSTPLTYQWQKNGTNLANATNATLTVANVGPLDAGNYAVVVTNAAGSKTSAAAAITVPTAATAPQITGPPASQIVAAGTTATFSVTATGAAPLTYQWIKDGKPLAGATAATLSLPAVSAATVGVYTVSISNAAGTVVSNPAQLSLSTSDLRFPGAYFGQLGGAGTFALFVRPDLSAVFLAYASSLGLIGRDAQISATGQFRFTATALNAATNIGNDPDYSVEGTITSTGVTGTISRLNLVLTSPPAGTAGSAAAVAGYYQAAVDRASAFSHAILGAGGEAFMLFISGNTADSGRGFINAAGGFDLSTTRNARVTGTVGNPPGSFTASMTSPGAATVTFVGANSDTRSNLEKLVNISTRSQVGGGNELIAGFVIAGDAAKLVLIRAIGPSLAAFGVNNALPAARLQIFHGPAVVATSDDWGLAPNAAAITAAASRVGAFEIKTNSRDAAALLTLAPGDYTAIVTGQNGASGVTLIEAYDASDGTVPSGQRIINISTRATAGAGDNTLITGFVITGSLPKRVLVRGAGPALAQFGVSGVLAQPRLSIYAGATLIAENSGVSTSPDAAQIARAAAQVGAFAFPSDSLDAALLINLSPGAYTAQVAGSAGGAGNALLELYELP